MNFAGVHNLTTYAHFVADVEVHRGRNHLWCQLLRHENPSSLNRIIGKQLRTIGRRVSRAEVAKRVAYIDDYHIKGLANKWFYDAEPIFTNWGPIEMASVMGSYKFFKVNTMSTVTNAHASLYY